jgi:hypothetical protein
MKSQLDRVQELLTKAHQAKYPERYTTSPEPEPFAKEGNDPIFDNLLEAIREATPNPFADARYLMAMEFKDKSPGTVYDSYKANVAMAIHDYLAHPIRRPKPTIDELEAILARDNQEEIAILPSGELTTKQQVHTDCNALAEKILHLIFES